jgi:hypothetical protein
MGRCNTDSEPARRASAANGRSRGLIQTKNPSGQGLGEHSRTDRSSSGKHCWINSLGGVASTGGAGSVNEDLGCIIGISRPSGEHLMVDHFVPTTRNKPSTIPSHSADGALRRSSAEPRADTPESQRHRQQADGDSHSRGQGTQRSRCDVRMSSEWVGFVECTHFGVFAAVNVFVAFDTLFSSEVTAACCEEVTVPAITASW